MNVVFITGATGLVGGNLVCQLLKNDPSVRLVLLVRADSDDHAVKRFRKAFSTISDDFNYQQVKDRISIVRGDITSSNLGMDERQYHEIINEITHIIHSAANVQFNLPLEQARQINCTGTENILSFAEHAYTLGKLRRMAHISTAYVSGLRTGKIYEDELTKKQEFANTYEQTKYETELIIRQRMSNVPIIIFRPSIIIGDSKTGRTSTFNVLYPALRLIYNNVLNILPGSRKTPIDIVPIDYVRDAILRILFHAPSPTGKTFHLTAGENIETTAGEIVDSAVEYFNENLRDNCIKRIIFLRKGTFDCMKRILPVRVRRALEAIEIYEPYLRIRRSFIDSNTRYALEGTGLIPPVFKTYCNNIFQYCLDVRWGKRPGLAMEA